MTDQHNPPTRPQCAICDRRPPPDSQQVCWPCQASIAADLDAIPQLAQLLPAAVAPSLAQTLIVGSRSTDTPLPGGDALNLTARSRTHVPVRLIPLVRTARTVDTWRIEHAGRIITVTHTDFSREHVTDDHGQPVLIPDGDQVGHLNPWTVLNQWVGEWARLREVGETGASYDDAGWLRERLDWAFRAHPDIAGWVAELRSTVGGMRAILAVKRHVVRYRDRCPRCDAPAALYRLVDAMLPADDPRVRYVNCGACGTMFDLDDDRIDGGSRAA